MKPQCEGRGLAPHTDVVLEKCGGAVEGLQPEMMLGLITQNDLNTVVLVAKACNTMMPGNDLWCASGLYSGAY